MGHKVEHYNTTTNSNNNNNNSHNIISQSYSSPSSIINNIKMENKSTANSHNTEHPQNQTYKSNNMTTFLTGIILLLLFLESIMLNISIVQCSRSVVIEPNPNREVGMMSSESKYFNCKLEGANKQSGMKQYN